MNKITQYTELDHSALAQIEGGGVLDWAVFVGLLAALDGAVATGNRIGDWLVAADAGDALNGALNPNSASYAGVVL